MVKGEFERQMEGYRLMARMLLECRNIRLFAFDDQFDITCNLDHYMDVIHYSEDTGDQLLEWMAAGEHMLTDDTVAVSYTHLGSRNSRPSGLVGPVPGRNIRLHLFPVQIKIGRASCRERV